MCIHFPRLHRKPHGNAVVGTIVDRNNRYLYRVLSLTTEENDIIETGIIDKNTAEGLHASLQSTNTVKAVIAVFAPFAGEQSSAREREQLVCAIETHVGDAARLQSRWRWATSNPRRGARNCEDSCLSCRNDRYSTSLRFVSGCNVVHFAGGRVGTVQLDSING